MPDHKTIYIGGKGFTDAEFAALLGWSQFTTPSQIRTRARLVAEGLGLGCSITTIRETAHAV